LASNFTSIEIPRVDDGDVAELTHLLVGGECDHVAGEREVAGSNRRLRVDLAGHLASLHIPQPEINL